LRGTLKIAVVVNIIAQGANRIKKTTFIVEGWIYFIDHGIPL
jgi:hypothetical protein